MQAGTVRPGFLPHPGESFVIPAGVVHQAHKVSSAPIKPVGVYVVEQGKPLASPAP